MLTRLLLDSTPGEGNGTTTAQDPAKGPDLQKGVDSLIGKHGDATAALRVLMGENYSYRDQIRELKGKIPSEGSVVLTGDQAKEWGAYQGLGKASELRKAIEEGSTARAELGTLRKAETLREAAELSGLNPTVLKDLKGADALEIEFVEAKGKDGKAVREARVKGEGDASTPLQEYAEKTWPGFASVLKGEATKPSPKGPGTPRSVPADRPASSPYRQGADPGEADPIAADLAGLIQLGM